VCLLSLDSLERVSTSSTEVNHSTPVLECLRKDVKVEYGDTLQSQSLMPEFSDVGLSFPIDTCSTSSVAESTSLHASICASGLHTSKSCDVDLSLPTDACSTDLNLTQPCEGPSKSVSSTRSQPGEHAFVSPCVSRVTSSSNTYVEAAEPEFPSICASSTPTPGKHAFVEPPISHPVQSVGVDSLDGVLGAGSRPQSHCPTDISPPVESSTVPCADQSSLPVAGVIPGGNVSSQPADEFSEFNRQGVCLLLTAVS
jgi:hypothetical protein